MTKFSLILPAYNQGAVLIASIWKIMDAFGSVCELVVVDDGSTDDTSKILKEIEGIRVIRTEQNIGKGYSVKRGILSSKGIYRIFTDADLPYGIEGIEGILRYLKKDFDVVIGQREDYTSNPYRFMAHGIFNLFVKRVTGLPFGDTQCGLKGFKGEVADDLFRRMQLNRFAFDVEILYLATLLNYKIYAMDIRQLSDSLSTITIRDAFKMFTDVKGIKRLHTEV